MTAAEARALERDARKLAIIRHRKYMGHCKTCGKLHDLRGAPHEELRNPFEIFGKGATDGSIQ